MTFRSIFRKPETTLYPIVEKAAPEGLKGHIENDMDLCIFCGICARTCPAGALRVEKAEGLWAIDRFACVQCGSCTRACPKSCLSMLPTYQKPSTYRQDDVFYKPDDSSDDKDVKDDENAARIDNETKAEPAVEQQEDAK